MKTRILTLFAIVLLFSASITTSYAQEEKMTEAKSLSTVTVHMQTNKGLIILELDSEKAPFTVANFLEYAKAGSYNGTIFHRVIPGFMIQGGAFEPSMHQRKSRPSIANEAYNGLKNDAFTIAMARTNEPHSASNQFFINAKDNDFLNFKNRTPRGWGYAVFGKVVYGKNVVTAIEKVPTGYRKGMNDVPVDPVIIQNVTLVD